MRCKVLAVSTTAFACLTLTGAAGAQVARFAVTADYGQSANTATVANRILSLNPDFICTCGDNTYSTVNATSNWDAAIGQYYKTYIDLPSNSAYYSQRSLVNRFFPTLGNHDFDVGTNGTSFSTYFAALPGNRRYYTFTRGPVQFFMLSSDPREPDGNSVGSVQYNWFVNQINQSTARWQVVMFHHPFQTSTGSHAPSTWMNWGFQNLGVDMVLAGHNHFMERLTFGGIPWFVTGSGGQSLYAFNSVPANSQFRNNSVYGFSLVTADRYTLKHQFISAAGVVLDTFTVGTPPVRCSVADINADGTVDGTDFVQFISSFAIGDTRVDDRADVDGDGSIDGNDFVAFINAFALGC